MSDVNNYLEHSIASGTLTQYKRSWEKWVIYSTLHKKSSLPASALVVAKGQSNML